MATREAIARAGVEVRFTPEDRAAAVGTAAAWPSRNTGG